MKKKMNIWEASREGNIDRVRQLLLSGQDVNRKEKDEDFTALSCASREGHLELAKFLIKKGADPSNGCAALSAACRGGHSEIAKFLLDNGADVNEQSGVHRLTPLHETCLSGNIETLEILLNAGADVNNEYCLGNTPICCANRKNNINIVKRLIKAGS